MRDDNKEFLDLKVLVIDDSKTIRRTAETLLKKVGCDVVTAENGFEALPVITSHHPDIIFIDIMVPRLDGYQTCSLIKNNATYKNTPVIMLSSKDGLFDSAKGRIVGAEQYLTKPFSRDDRLNAIRPLSKDDETKNMPVIIVSSKTQETDKVWGMRQGAKGYLDKPVTEERRMDEINNLLQAKS